MIELFGCGGNNPRSQYVQPPAATLTVQIGRHMSQSPRHVVIDATGLKAHGKGEGNRHGARRRTGRKLHWAVDAGNHEIKNL